MRDLIAIRWTGGKGFFIYRGGHAQDWFGWRWVICAGPFTIFLCWHDTAWWERWRSNQSSTAR